MIKFANYSIGVHGVDLPKYNDAAHDQKKFWKFKKDYV